MADQTMTTAGAERVGDAERELAARLVADATGDGLLHFDEMDERLSRVFAARTTGELAAITADLPATWLRQRARSALARDRRTEAVRGFGQHLRTYLLVMSGLVAIWAVVGLTAGAWYPWPIWPALGWGLGVFSHARAAYGGGVQPGRGWGCHSHPRRPVAES